MMSGMKMTREEELIKAGWTRQFVACEPRLSEMVALYSEIGFEVLIEPLPGRDELPVIGCESTVCKGCLDAQRESYRIIFTRNA